MPLQNYFFNKISEIIDNAGIKSEEVYIDFNIHRNIKSLRRDIRDCLEGFVYWEERNFLVFSGYNEKDLFIGKFSPEDQRNFYIDRVIASLDETYPSLELNIRTQEDIPLIKIDSGNERVFSKIVNNCIFNIGDPFVILSRYDDFGLEQCCRIITYH